MLPSHARPLRSLADRRPAHRRRPHGAVQLAARPRPRRRARAAHRGHRPRALDARERRADPRGARLARDRLGRRAGLPVRSAPSATPRCVERLLAGGHAYRSTAGPGRGQGVQGGSTATAASAATDEGEGAVRLRVPDEGVTAVRDVIRGETEFENALQDDLVIARADGTPVYHLAVVVDDLDAGITHVVRGADHYSNTPKQMLILRGAGRQHARLRPRAAAARPGRQEALQAPRRRVGAGAARPRLPARGGPQLPGAARLGLRRGRRRSSRPRSSSASSRSSASRKSPAVFDEQKLRWMNGRYVRELPRRRPHRAARGADRPDGPARRGRDHAGEDLDARRVLAAGAASSSTARSTTPRRARSSSRPRAARRRSRAAREALAGLDGAVEPGDRRGRAARGRRAVRR